jgi:hypothetical protein
MNYFLLFPYYILKQKEEMIYLNLCPMGTFIYAVRYGDTLWLLADRYHTTVEDIISLNPGIDPNNLSVGQQLCLPLIESDIDDEDAVLDLSNELRILWEQHITWTRIVIASLIYDLPELEFAVTRLLRNAADFASLFELFYGADVARRIQALFTDHFLIARELVLAAKANDSQKFEMENQKFFENADAIARLLSDNNPFWDYEMVKNMFYQHLELIKNEVSNFLNNRFEENIQLYDDMEMQALAMADLMLEGLIRQFPEDFD